MWYEKKNVIYKKKKNGCWGNTKEKEAEKSI